MSARGLQGCGGDKSLRGVSAGILRVRVSAEQRAVQPQPAARAGPVPFVTMARARSLLRVALAALALLAAVGLAAAAKKKEVPITHRVYFDVEIGGEKAGACAHDTRRAVHSGAATTDGVRARPTGRRPRQAAS